MTRSFFRIHGAPHTLRLLTLGFLALEVVACGGAKKPALKDAADAPAKKEAPPKVVVPELVEAAAPDSLIARGRVTKPEMLIGYAVRAVTPGLPWKQLAEARLPGFTAAFDLQAPLELAVTVDGDPDSPKYAAAFSVAIKDRDTFLELAKARNRVEELDKTYAVVGSSCVLATARGAAKTRFICALSQRAPAPAMVAYMRGGLPTEPVEAGMDRPDGPHLALRIEGDRLRSFYGPKLEQKLLEGESRLGALAAALGEGGADMQEAGIDGIRKHVAALDAATLWASVDAAGELQMATGLAFDANAKDTWLVERSALHQGRQGEPLAAFWRLPGDALVVASQRADGDDSVASLLKPLVDALPKLESMMGLPPSVTKYVKLLQEDWWGEGRDYVGAYGAEAEGKPSKAVKKLDGELAKLVKQGAFFDRFWGLAGYDATISDTKALFEATDALLGDRELVAFFERFTDKKARELRGLWPKSRVRSAPRSLKLSSEAFMFEVSIPLRLRAYLADEAAPDASRAARRTAARALPDKFYYVVDARDGLTWVAFGSDPRAAAKHILAADADADAAGTLASTEAKEALAKVEGMTIGRMLLGSYLGEGLKAAGIDLDAMPQGLPFDFWTKAHAGEGTQGGAIHVSVPLTDAANFAKGIVEVRQQAQ